MSEATGILNKIISRGGIYGEVAKLIPRDEATLREFLQECHEQCKNKSMSNFWGEEIYKDLENYFATQNL